MRSMAFHGSEALLQAVHRRWRYVIALQGSLLGKKRRRLMRDVVHKTHQLNIGFITD